MKWEAEYKPGSNFDRAHWRTGKKAELRELVAALHAKLTED